MKTKRNTILTLILAFILLLSPVLTCATVAFAVEPQYSKAYTGALKEKMRLLKESKDAKTVVVGGSSVAFGLNSELIGKYTKTRAVNFGLYAALGTKMMLELSLPSVRKGDTVILMPELDAQTLSMYFNAEQALMAFDGHFGDALTLDAEDKTAMLGGMWKFSADKLRYAIGGNAPDPEGVYNAKNFNRYGDILYDRPHNVMPDYYEKNRVLTFENDLLSDDFADYLNRYITACKAKGATVYYAFCPVNEMAISPEADVLSFEKYMKSKIHCTFLNRLSDCIMEAGYFYDSNFHLNESGAQAFTIALVNDLLLKRNDMTFVSETVPEAPALPQIDSRWEGKDENDVMFTYTQEENGTLTVTGLTDLGKRQKVLTLPLGTNGRKVVTVGTNALAGGTATDLIIPADSFVRVLDDACFEGADRLGDLWILLPEPTDVKPPLYFGNIGSDFEFHVPKDKNLADYFWNMLDGLNVTDDAENAPIPSVSVQSSGETDGE